MFVTLIRLLVKFCWLSKVIFQILCAFFLKLKGELTLAYESYARGVLIVILIEILNDYYLFYLVLAGNNEPLRWHPPHLMYNTDTQYLGGQHLQQCRFFIFFSICCRCFCLSVCVCTFVCNLKFLKTHNYWLARLYMRALIQG